MQMYRVVPQMKRGNQKAQFWRVLIGTTVKYDFNKLQCIWYIIPSFPYRGNSVHLHECSPFWVGILITFNK